MSRVSGGDGRFEVVSDGRELGRVGRRRGLWGELLGEVGVLLAEGVEAHRPQPDGAAEEQADAADPPRSPSTNQHDGVPIFPDTRDGRAARLA